MLLCSYIDDIKRLICRFTEEYEAALAGAYKLSASEWLGSSWQGDALQVLGSRS